MGKSLCLVWKRFIFVGWVTNPTIEDASEEIPQAWKGMPPSREQEMQAEILRLRQALEYSELRNEALNEVLKIGREEYGVDLLKKAGAKQ